MSQKGEQRTTILRSERGFFLQVIGLCYLGSEVNPIGWLTHAQLSCHHSFQCSLVSATGALAHDVILLWQGYAWHPQTILGAIGHMHSAQLAQVEHMFHHAMK